MIKVVRAEEEDDDDDNSTLKLGEVFDIKRIRICWRLSSVCSSRLQLISGLSRMDGIKECILAPVTAYIPIAFAIQRDNITGPSHLTARKVYILIET